MKQTGKSYTADLITVSGSCGQWSPANTFTRVRSPRSSVTVKIPWTSVPRVPGVTARDFKLNACSKVDYLVMRCFEQEHPR